MTALMVTKSGPRTTVQDLGRSGYQHQGLSPGGAADLRSFRWANHLLGNGTNAACLEITLGGFTATARQPLFLAITGADCQGTVNGKPIPHWGVFFIEAGDELELSTPSSGLLTYLAVVGGWQTRAFCGSRSCVSREGLTDLGVLAAETALPAMETPADLDMDACLKREVPAQVRCELESNAPLKLIPGPEYPTFSNLDRARFLSACYTVGHQSDRMAYRLDGPALQSAGGIVSKGVTCGTVQVPGDGKPMVLLNDRQTIGGYPIIGTVARLDCGRLAQKRPGEPVEFQWADVADCQSERLLFEQQFNMTPWAS
ncbi:biotin-dependent carboxyltransferase family protein [Marinobacter lacisalsi]|uniref:Biotin-dependent carboxyltransferase family protein n=1 Tax=Marinobacter lacisalsi TaxID=475979 RepID=A0ABV8QJE3_9GAMM